MIFSELENIELEKRDNQKVVSLLFGSSNQWKMDFNFSTVSNVLMEFFPHAEGYVKQTTVSGQMTFDYVFNHTDHLGNIRVSYMKDPNNGQLKILEENHYYPFGLKHSKYAPLVGKMSALADESGKAIIDVDPNDEIIKASLYKYKYNGKELQDELGLSLTAMDARNYDPALGRFNVVDPMAAFAPSHTPYRFGFNNPVYWSDPTGMYEYDDDGNVVIRHWDEVLFFLDYFFSGESMDGLEMALQDAGYGLDLEEATITGSPKSKNNSSQYAFSGQCIVGCHQTPGMDFSKPENTLFRRTNETFYWHTGGSGAGYSSYMRPGDRSEMSDLLEWLSGSGHTPPSTKVEGMEEILTLVQIWSAKGSSTSVMDALAPPQAKDTIIKTTVREANSAYRGAYKHKDGGFGRTGTFYRSKDTIIHTTTDKVEKVKSIIDSIDNSRL